MAIKRSLAEKQALILDLNRQWFEVFDLMPVEIKKLYWYGEHPNFPLGKLIEAMQRGYSPEQIFERLKSVFKVREDDAMGVEYSRNRHKAV